MTREELEKIERQCNHAAVRFGRDAVTEVDVPKLRDLCAMAKRLLETEATKESK